MDFSYNEDEKALRELSREILGDFITQDRLREVEGSEDRIDRKAWSALAEANLLGVALPEEYGGSDMGMASLVILHEEIGRTVARALVLNEDLVESLALCHDLGHTPFGHLGEGFVEVVHYEVDHEGALRGIEVCRVIFEWRPDGEAAGGIVSGLKLAPYDPAGTPSHFLYHSPSFSESLDLKKTPPTPRTLSMLPSFRSVISMGPEM